MTAVSEKAMEVAPDSRREFLRNLLSGAATATVLMVFGPGVSAKHLTHRQGHAETEHEWAYVININNCIGCGNCVRACGRENAVPAGVFRTWVERYVVTEDGVYVESPNGALQGFESVNSEIAKKAKFSFTVPKMCNHCLNPPCVQACPYGARFINPVKKVSDKCTWCYHRVKAGKLPACVTVCPNKARLFGDLRDPDSEVAQIFKDDKWLILKPHMDTTPYCFYVGLPREVI